ncbi:hypothetical protein NDU88_004895, partial [Pleurodeles waltl]
QAWASQNATQGSPHNIQLPVCLVYIDIAFLHCFTLFSTNNSIHCTLTCTH